MHALASLLVVLAAAGMAQGSYGGIPDIDVFESEASKASDAAKPYYAKVRAIVTDATLNNDEKKTKVDALRAGGGVSADVIEEMDKAYVAMMEKMKAKGR